MKKRMLKGDGTDGCDGGGDPTTFPFYIEEGGTR